METKPDPAERIKTRLVSSRRGSLDPDCGTKVGTRSKSVDTDKKNENRGKDNVSDGEKPLNGDHHTEGDKPAHRVVEKTVFREESQMSVETTKGVIVKNKRVSVVRRRSTSSRRGSLIQERIGRVGSQEDGISEFPG